MEDLYDDEEKITPLFSLNREQFVKVLYMIGGDLRDGIWNVQLDTRYIVRSGVYPNMTYYLEYYHLR